MALSTETFLTVTYCSEGMADIKIKETGMFATHNRWVDEYKARQSFKISCVQIGHSIFEFHFSVVKQVLQNIFCEGSIGSDSLKSTALYLLLCPPKHFAL